MIPTIYEEVKSGNINALDITTDYLHPNDIGHKMVCSVICYYLEEIYKDRLIEEDMGYQLLEAITENGFENTISSQLFIQVNNSLFTFSSVNNLHTSSPLSLDL